MQLLVEDLVRERNGTLIASFPRSGSTLTAKFVTHVMRRNFPIARHALATALLPTMGRSVEASEIYDIVGVVARTHAMDDLGRRRTVFIFRSPDDAVLSYYVKFKAIADTWKLRRFLRRNLKEWAEGVDKAYELASRGDPDLHLFCYENFLADAESESRKVIRFLGLAEPEGFGAMIAELNQEYRSRAGQREANPYQTAYGTVGSSQNFYTKKMRTLIEETYRPKFERLRALTVQQEIIRLAS